MLVTLAWPAATGAAQATPATDASPRASGPCDQREPTDIDGIFVEARLARTVIAGVGPPEVRADTTIVCIETGIEAFSVSQVQYATTIVVLSGELTVNVDGAAGPGAVAVYYLAVTPDQPVDLASASTPVTLTAGDMLVIGNVDIAVTPSTTGPTRILTTGIAIDGGGAGCPPCVRWPPR